ncbi:rhodanese-like domain-containing protein [Pseudoxanthomonas sacheonensis]|uniref:Rhodanese-related sulfurtransferase n=1 Tax=Pseudoxanthomonas sacheonensis TaxID=443615 RepID=A0ABU1RTR9_9GAMM|nr:rhodanese-like domain-containing protein [Pseudoxanthomonas sacheonensis]MDR6842168.1 rhodanese-related sulfurtransferase [Pseudoxanthomonas sacheonensis]
MLIVKAGACRAALLVLFCLVYFQASAQAAMGATAQVLSGAQGAVASDRSVDLEITPEGVLALKASGTPYLLVDADADSLHAPTSGPVRIIYYARTPAFRSAQLLALRDRNAAPMAVEPSQRLTGTPLEWERLKLPMGQPFDQNDPIPLTPRQLSQAMRDEVDLQIIDLRPSSGEQQGIVEFANSLRVLPDQLSAESKKLSQQRWTVVVDGAGGMSRNAAGELKRQGFRLATYLAGGYSAWVAAKDRDLGPSIPPLCAKP